MDSLIRSLYFGGSWQGAIVLVIGLEMNVKEASYTLQKTIDKIIYQVFRLCTLFSCFLAIFLLTVKQSIESFLQLFG